jgi:hypothetical protein
MIDSVLNLLFRCPHKRLTRAVTPTSIDGRPPGETYVACLDCGKHFSYDLEEMRIGKPVPGSPVAGARPPHPHKAKVKLAVALAVPLGIILGSVWSSRRKKKSRPPDQPPLDQ